MKSKNKDFDTKNGAPNLGVSLTVVNVNVYHT